MRSVQFGLLLTVMLWVILSGCQARDDGSTQVATLKMLFTENLGAEMYEWEVIFRGSPTEWVFRSGPDVSYGGALLERYDVAAAFAEFAEAAELTPQEDDGRLHVRASLTAEDGSSESLTYKGTADSVRGIFLRARILGDMYARIAPGLPKGSRLGFETYEEGGSWQSPVK